MNRLPAVRAVTPNQKQQYAQTQQQVSSISAVAFAENHNIAAQELVRTAVIKPARRPNIEWASSQASSMVIKPLTALGSLAAAAVTGNPVAASFGSTYDDAATSQ